jgi:signal transduction histidine kinase/ActR/RegA family two-component response regulator
VYSQQGAGVFTRNRIEKVTARSRGKEDAGSLLRLSRAGTSHADWIRQAVQELRGSEHVERIGVWLEEPQCGEPMDAGPVIFRGEVWDQGIGNGPQEWSRLSSDAPLPKELLDDQSCEYELGAQNPRPIFGPLVDLGRVLWVPVTAQRTLRGLVMLGVRQKQAPVARERAEKVAEQLGLLLELEEARRLATARKADLELWRRMQSLLSEGQNANMILGQLAESCTRGGSLGGVGGVFALIGERKSGLPVTTLSSAAGEEQLVIRAQSGEAHWASSVNQGPLETIWRHAVAEQRAIGVEANRLPQAKEISRVVAIPLGRKDAISGVLLAGLPRRMATLEGLERLELRAMLAEAVLESERRTDAAAREEQWHQALLESAAKPVVLVDGQGLVRAMSWGARELLHRERTLTETNSASLRFAELFRARQWERVQAWLVGPGQAKPQEKEQTLESELATGLDVVLTRLPISAPDFSAVGLEQIRDKGHPRRVEDVEEELRQAIEWLEEGVAVFDEHGEILARNSRFLQILGLREKNGQILRTLEDLIQETAKNFAAPEIFAAEWRARAQDGAAGTQEELAMEKPVPQLIERYTRPMVAANGRKLGRVEVYRETTARRMFQSRMLRAEKLASLGQRVTGIMHELSNPLTTILGNAQRMILREEAGTPSTEAQRILEEAERATAILRQLLYLSRDAQPERRLVSLNELVERVVNLQRETLAGGSMLLKVDLAERLPRVEGDFAQLQQVLLNLLQNAQQAIEQSGQGTTIGVRTSSAVPGRVRLEVWDDGPGIPEALQARIFDPFFTTKPEGLGTGLGLAIVNGFVRQHGGSISVHCPPDGGTRFVVELPAAEDAREAEKRSFAKDLSPSLAFPVRQSGNGHSAAAGKEVPRILVVEDEATVANLIADVLRDEGMNVDVLLDSESAFEAAQKASYDLAICDLKMPGMDGQVFYAKLLQEQNPLHEHVLFVTGDVIAQRTHEFLEQNRLAHVAKPFRVEELCAAVRKMLWGSTRAATP